MIKEKYPPIHYKIIWANENYAALHEGKEAGKVYAISTHPKYKKKRSYPKKKILCWGGVPTLVEFENHKSDKLFILMIKENYRLFWKAILNH